MKSLRAQMMDVKEVMIYLGRSAPYCYRLIRKLNAELEAKGYLTESGRISRRYLTERYYTEKSSKTS